MIKKLLCKLGFHKWFIIFDAFYYEGKILNIYFSKCERCGKRGLKYIKKH
jgi:hypothetical protein